jgi:microcystin-dependent protein
MEDFILGEIVLLPYSYYFKVMNFRKCDGQRINYIGNEILFSILYGNQTPPEDSFELPNLTEKNPIPDLNSYICIRGVCPQFVR